MGKNSLSVSPPAKKQKKKVKLPKSAKVEIGHLLVSSIKILIEPCRGCDVDYDAAADRYVVDPTHPLEFACLVGVHLTDGLKPKEVYIAPVSELQPITTTVLSFTHGEDRVSTLFCIC
jgi:hypothetical protein